MPIARRRERTPPTPATMTTPIRGSLSWDNLGCELHPWLREAVASLGFATMTPVQASAIPLFAGNKDVVVQAVTGSGKTLAYVLPVLERLSRRLDEDSPVARGRMFGVVIAPTRELAHQIEAVFALVLALAPPDRAIKTQLLIGSLQLVRDDVERFLAQRPQILIGTPGRLLDFLGSAHVRTNDAEVVVLDEADRLLDIGFEKDVVAILAKLPKQRRTGLFLATLEAAGDTIFRTGMANPVRVAVKSKRGAGAGPASLNISYMPVVPQYKLVTMMKLLQHYQYQKAIVYFPTCAAVKHFYSVIQHHGAAGLKFHSLHGQLQAKPRLKTLAAFAEGDTFAHRHVLMTTDVAARGIDIPDVDLVLQIDPPTDPDVFLHRCGRTGRANKVGHAIVMLNQSSREEGYVDFMQVKGVNMSVMDAPAIDPLRDALGLLRQYMLHDRQRHEVAVRAYVGFIRYYSKHMASSIFRMSLLDYLGVARMYGLLRLPKMPEARHIGEMPDDGWLGEPIDMDHYAYADAAKEQQRVATLEEVKATKIADAKKRKEFKKRNEAWSSKLDHKEVKADRREKMKRKREAIEKQVMEESSDDETALDWKEVVKSAKKTKHHNNVQGAFEGL